MSTYQVIARKFRPQTFADVVGQNHVTQTLQNAIKLGRIPHAFLFTGTRGCGKTSTARIFAKALNCSAGEGPQPEPCNECENCKEISAGSSLDVLEIDGASNNGVESIRELRENVRFMPNKGRFKVYIIDEAHMLSTAAWNALLKTLEEPPAHVIFVFATTEPQKILQTILSRVQRFDFKRIPMRAIAKRLQEICEAEDITIGASGLSALARAADGSLRDGQSLLDQLIAFAGNEIDDQAVTDALGLIDRTLVMDAVRGLAARDAQAAISVARRVADAGHNAEAFAQAILRQLRDLMVIKIVDEPAQLVERSEEELEALLEIADAFSREDVDALFAMLSGALEDLRADSPYLVLEMTLLRMSAAEPMSTLSELIERVEALAGGAGPSRGGSGSGSSSGGSGARKTGTPSASRGKPTFKRPKFMEEEDAGAKQKKVARQERVSRAPSEAAAPANEAPANESPAPAPAPAPKHEANLDWKGFVKYVRDRSFLGTYLANHCWVESFDGDNLVVGVRKGSVAESPLTSGPRIEELAGHLQAFLEHEAKLVTKVVRRDDPAEAKKPNHPKAGPSTKRRAKREEAKALREEALQEPAVKDAMDTLDAELAEVRPLRGGPKGS